MTESVAQIYGRRWGARAAMRAEHYAGMSRPAWEAMAAATGVGAGCLLLDVACGSGEFGTLARGRGAQVHGIDAAAGMIALARAALPDADLRVGTLERLPWPDGAMDVVTGFNAFQFAPDMVAALAEAARVTRAGGQVAVCNWSASAPGELLAVIHMLQGLQPEPTLVPRRPIGEAGVLEAMLEQTGLRPRQAAEVAVPWAPPDRQTLERGLLSAGNIAPSVAHAGEEAVRAAIVEACRPHRRGDGSYLFRDTFRYVVAGKPAR